MQTICWTRLQCALVGALLLIGMGLAGPIHADVVITSDTTINSTINDNVVVDAGRVTVAPGAVIKGAMSARYKSEVDITGGTIGTPNVAGTGLYAYDTSKVYIFGGTFSYISAFQTSYVDLSGGSTGALGAYNSSTVSVSGGTTENLDAAYTSTVIVSGGSIRILTAHDSSTVKLVGGSVMQMHVAGAGTVYVYGNNLLLTYTSGSGAVENYSLTGTLRDGTSIHCSVLLEESGAVLLVLPAVGGAAPPAVPLRYDLQPLGAARLANAVPLRYDVEDLGTAGGTGSVGTGIGPGGQVVGYRLFRLPDSSQTISSGILWSNGVPQPLFPLELTQGSESIANAVNASSRVAATTIDSANQRRPVAWLDGTLIDLHIAGGVDSGAWGINDAGAIVGSTNISSSVFHAFLWTPEQGKKDLGTFPGGVNSRAYGINNQGQVVGIAQTPNGKFHACIWTGQGPPKDLGTLGGSTSEAYGINDRGQVVGYADWRDAPILPPYGPSNAALWTNGQGPPQDLHTLKSVYSIARSINSAGQIVGTSWWDNPDGQHAFLYTGETGLIDLNSRIDPKLGWVLQSAAGINDAGQIAGFGQHNGETRAFRLVPIGPSIDAAINNRGRVVGNSYLDDGTVQLFSLADGKLTGLPIGIGGATFSVASINDPGEIAGSMSDTPGTSVSFVKGDQLLPLPMYPGSTEWGGANAINNLGQVVGGAGALGSGSVYSPVAYLYDKSRGTKPRPLGTLKGGTASTATAINDFGEAVGWSNTEPGQVHAFLRLVNGSMWDLGTLPGGTFSEAAAISPTGDVAGTATTTVVDELTGGPMKLRHAVLWPDAVESAAKAAATPIVDLGTLGGSNSHALAINDHNQVVGYSDISGDQTTHAFLFADGVMLDLNPFLTSNSSWTLTKAIAINGAGQIVCIANQGQPNQPKIVLLTPR